jgi:hypothetical protein
MAGIVQNIISNSLSGFVSGAVTTIGGYAGDAVGSVGNMIERGGQQVGNGEFVLCPSLLLPAPNLILSFDDII